MQMWLSTSGSSWKRGGEQERSQAPRPIFFALATQL